MDEVVPRPRPATAPEVEIPASSGSSGPPAVLGDRYRVLDLAGRGGMADVHRAVDEVLGRQVAVKVFRAGAGAESRRFEFEVRLAASLDHRQLVRVYDAGIDGEHRWCVMQLVTGGTLADLPGPVPAATAAAVAADVADALAYLHERGIVHRDVKPSNVLVGEHGEAYLSDFGICGVAGDADARLGGPALGTPAYLSPEQVRGEPAAPPCDVYALGLVVLECLTGRREYPGEPLAAALARLTREPAVPPDADARLAALLRAMTATDPARRPRADEAARRLRALVPGPAQAPASLAAAGPAPAPTRRRAVLVALGACAVVGLGSVAAVTSDLLAPGGPERSTVAAAAGTAAGEGDAESDVLGVRSAAVPVGLAPEPDPPAPGAAAAAPAGGDPTPSPTATDAPPAAAPPPRPSPSVTPAPDAADRPPAPGPSPTGNAPDSGGSGPGTGEEPGVPPGGGPGAGPGGGPRGSPADGADDGKDPGTGKDTGARDDDTDDDDEDEDEEKDDEDDD